LTAGAPQLGAGAAVGTAFAAGGLGVAGAATLRASAGALATAARGVSSVISGRAFSSNAGGGGPGGGSSGPPAWARRMRRQQAMSQGISAAVHAIRSGDHGGASTSVNLRQEDR
jgi:type IV secretion system protein TrbL